MNIVPIKLRPHLIPFFYKEFKGIEAFYLNKKVKACKISQSSTIGFMLRTTLQKADIPAKAAKNYVYFTLSNASAEAKLYSVEKNFSSFLKVPDFVAEKINDILEDQFRIAFQYYVKGMLDGNPEMLVRTAIERFMVEYQLDECGFELESLRRLYSRGKAFTMSRMQVKSAKRIYNSSTR